jgi:hypothetical protein
VVLKPSYASPLIDGGWQVGRRGGSRRPPQHGGMAVPASHKGHERVVALDRRLDARGRRGRCTVASYISSMGLDRRSRACITKIM